MTDEEVICRWMDDPKKPGYHGHWWAAGPHGWEPVALDLDRLREVEAQLSVADKYAYERRLRELLSGDPDGYLWHASAAQKIAALAAVLRK